MGLGHVTKSCDGGGGGLLLRADVGESVWPTAARRLPALPSAVMPSQHPWYPVAMATPWHRQRGGRDQRGGHDPASRGHARLPTHSRTHMQTHRPHVHKGRLTQHTHTSNQSIGPLRWILVNMNIHTHTHTPTHTHSGKQITHTCHSQTASAPAH